MEKEINIAEILRDKPKGTKLYSPIFGKCKLSKAESDTCIRVHTDNNHYYFNKYGHYTTNAMNSIYGECCLFPSKEMHDWSKFAWKKGDVLVSNDGGTEVIFDHWYDDYTNFYGKHYLCSEDENDIKYYEDFLCSTDRYSIEAEDAAQCYISTIEERLGGKLDMETLEVELIKPKWTLKPFDYVLSNDNDDNEWTLCQFSHIDKKGNTVFVGGSYADKGKIVLPYKGNEHLLGTNKTLKD